MKVHIIGEDERSKKLRDLYSKDNVSINLADVIICPIPFSRDGININNSNMSIESFLNTPNIDSKTIYTGALNNIAKEKLNEKNIKVIDIMDNEAFAIKNAIATAEGAIKKVIEMTPFTINQSNILIMGYGRIGKILSHYLSSFGANIYVEARAKKDIALIKSMGYNEVELDNLDDFLPQMDVIINTIPYLILDEKRVELLGSNSYFLDLASTPGGADFEALNKRNIKSSWYLSIPSKDSPLSAAKYIKETIDEINRGNEKWEKKST